MRPTTTRAEDELGHIDFRPAKERSGRFAAANSQDTRPYGIVNHAPDSPNAYDTILGVLVPEVSNIEQRHRNAAAGKLGAPITEPTCVVDDKACQGMSSEHAPASVYVFVRNGWGQARQRRRTMIDTLIDQSLRTDATMELGQWIVVNHVQNCVDVDIAERCRLRNPDRLAAVQASGLLPSILLPNLKFRSTVGALEADHARSPFDEAPNSTLCSAGFQHFAKPTSRGRGDRR
jgi:hypothetical protein